MESPTNYFSQDQLGSVCWEDRWLEPSHGSNYGCIFAEAGASDRKIDLADSTCIGPESVSESPGTLALNPFIPIVPELGLGEVQHRRRAEYDAVDAQISYSLRRYLTSLSPHDRESRAQPQQDEISWLRQDPFLLPPSRRATEASYGRHSRSYSRQSGSLKSNASGCMSFGLDPTSAIGGWMNEDALAGWPVIIDEDAVFDGEDNAAHLAALQDRGEHEALIAERNHLLNYNKPLVEHKTDWQSDESLKSDSENSFLSSTDMIPYSLAEEPRILPLMTCKNEPESKKEYNEAVHNMEESEFRGVALNKDQSIEAHKLITTQASNVGLKGLERFPSPSVRSDCGKELLLETLRLPDYYEKDQGTALSLTSNPDIKLSAKFGHFEAALSDPTQLITTLSDNGMNRDNKILTISDEATCLEGDQFSECTTEDSARDDSSAYSQNSSSAVISDITDGADGESTMLDGNALSAGIPEGAKQAVVNQLMQEIWGIFDKEWEAEFVACGENERKPSSPPRQRPLTSARALIQKRQRRDNDDINSSEDDSGRAPKRSSPNQKPPDGIDRLALSCPFRKNNPRKYNFPKYRPCALSSWSSVGRVKEHIYRRHRVPIHCTRCWMVFDTEDSLITHSREANRCHVQPKPPLDGITPEIERLLRSRKKEYRGQSEPEIWKKIYRILFPNEIVPSPYYEAIWVGNEDHPDTQELANYDEYYRRELPRLIRSHLESAVKSQLIALENALRTQLDDIIHDCINQLSTNYETARARTAAADSSGVAATLPAPIPIRTLVSQAPDEVRQRHAQNNSIESAPELQPTSDFLTSLNQSPGLPPTPADLVLHTWPYLSNDMLSRRLPNVDQENPIPNLHAATDCFCPLNSCTCLGRNGLGQLRGHYLEPAAFEFDTPAKILERPPRMEDWNLDDSFTGEGSDMDALTFS